MKKKNDHIGRLFLKIEGMADKLSTSGYNPFYYTGAVGIIFLYAILLSGIYLFIFYEISIKGAYSSVEYISKEQWYFGGVMRSIHRYASDGLIMVIILHVLRLFVFKRYANFRWVAWVSGVIAAIVIALGGIFGYLMVWDEKALLIATLSAELFGKIPVFGLPLGLAFARIENLTDQFFYIVLFIHFSTIAFLFALLWIHLIRITKAVIHPPKPIIYGILALLLLMSVLNPAASDSPADLKMLPAAVSIDWFYMFIYPLFNYLSVPRLWFVMLLAAGFVILIPWLIRQRRYPSAEVTDENCTGCGLCMEDCPYVAIEMKKRDDDSGYPALASVSAARCASCGLCVGACEYNAINLPNLTEEFLKERIRTLSRELKSNVEGRKIFVFSCQRGMELDDKMKNYRRARVVKVPCIGMLQPAMLEIPLKQGVDGVMVIGCKKGDCAFRFGNRWFEDRLDARRMPVVSKSVDRSRVCFLTVSKVEEKEFFKGLEEFYKG